MAKTQRQPDLVNMAQDGARKSKFLTPLIIIALIVIGLGSLTAHLDNIITFCRKYFTGESAQPSADEITALGRRALWSNEYLGSREAYSQLLDWKNSIKDPKTGKLLSAEIKRVEDDYRTDIMRGHIDTWPLICIPHVDCRDGFVKPEGFLAGNVLDHLGPNRRADERARAACILRNVGTSPDKSSIAKKELYENLTAALSSTAMAVGEWQFALLFRASILDVFYRGLLNQFIKCHGHARGYLLNHMGEQESSLCVSKMAFETYKDLTGFSSDGVFDFAGAVKDWKKRKDEILKVNF